MTKTIIEELEEIVDHRVDIYDEKFINVGYVHDWRNYIPRWMKDMWDGLPKEAKIVAYYLAEEQAKKEEWE